MLLRGNFPTEQPFSASYWAYTFGAAALSLSLLRFVERGMVGPFPALAVVAFVGANLVIAGIASASALSLARGKYLPPA